MQPVVHLHAFAAVTLRLSKWLERRIIFTSPIEVFNITGNQIISSLTEKLPR
jgi:hypothetical protein